MWGSGKPVRELCMLTIWLQLAYIMGLPKDFLEVVPDPMCSLLMWALARIHIAQKHAMAKTGGCTGELIFDKSKPDGAMCKVIDVGRLKRAGWEYNIDLEQGLALTYSWFLANFNDLRR